MALFGDLIAASQTCAAGLFQQRGFGGARRMFWQRSIRSRESRAWTCTALSGTLAQSWFFPAARQLSNLPEERPVPLGTLFHDDEQKRDVQLRSACPQLEAHCNLTESYPRVHSARRQNHLRHEWFTQLRGVCSTCDSK